MEVNKFKKDLIKLDLVSKIKKLIDEWNEIHKRDGKVTQNNFEELIKRAREIVDYLKELEPLCNPPVDDIDVKLLNLVREKKVYYDSLAFDIEVNWKRMSKLNDELLVVRIDNKRTKGCLFIIFENAEDKKSAKEQMNLFYNLHKKLKFYTNENDDCDAISLLNDLEEIKTWFPHPFTYIFIPEGGDREMIEELLRESLGRELNSKKLKEVYFSKETKKPNSFPVFRLRVKEKRPSEEIVERGYFFADPDYYKEMKEKGNLYAK